MIYHSILCRATLVAHNNERVLIRQQIIIYTVIPLD